MPEAIRGGRELDRHERRALETIELAAVIQNRCDDALLGDAFDPVVQHQPLVVPRHEPARLGEDRLRRQAAGGKGVADFVVKFQERDVRLRDDEIFVVAMIANQREAFRAARQIVAMVAGHAAGRDVDVLSDEQLRPRILAAGISRVARVQVTAAVGPQTVYRIEIQCRRSEVLDGGRVRLLLANRRQIQRDIVIDELAQVREACRDVRIVPGCAGRVCIRHRIREFLQRRVVDRERFEVREHPPEHSWILMP